MQFERGCIAYGMQCGRWCTACADWDQLVTSRVQGQAEHLCAGLGVP
jgi:hypothetical protein